MKQLLVWVLMLMLMVGQVSAYDNKATDAVFWWSDGNKISKSEDALEGYCQTVTCKGWGEKAKYCQITKPGSARPPTDAAESEYPKKVSTRPCVYKEG